MVCDHSTETRPNLPETSATSSVVAIDVAAVVETLRRRESDVPRSGRNELTAEAVEDFLPLGMGTHRKGENQHVCGITTDCVRARGERQLLAEEMHAAVVVPHAAVHGERDLVRPADELAGFVTK